MLDLAINFGEVIDTRRKVKQALHIGVQAGKIAAIKQSPLEAKQMICAAGLIVSPGFIDVHGHVDGYAYSGELCVCQGITTTIGGNCGLSPVDMGEFFCKQEQVGFVINQAELVGHSFSLRQAVGLSDPYRKASIREIGAMARLAEEALTAGAAGISFGLDYAPGASFAEIVALAEICASFDRVMPIHTRLFTQNDLYSLYEILSVAKRTGVRLLFSHFVYQYGTGIMREALMILDRALSDGLKIKIDSGMYTDWTTFIGTATFDEQSIQDSELRFSDMVAASGKYAGRRLNKALYLEMRRDFPTDSVICFTGKKEEIYEALKKPYAMPSTDVGAYQKGEGHPQIAGTFPKYIKEMVKERGDLALPEAIYKATLLPAQTFGFWHKGCIEIGADADLTIFDLEKLADKADFPHMGKPDAKPEGIVYVIVNGSLVVADGHFTGKRAGRIERFNSNCI